MKNDFKRTKYACYFSYVSTASAFALPPVLFLPFREMFGISYTQLGALVLVNFFTQMSVDLIFSFFSRFFNLKKTVRTMPLVTMLGLILYALLPTFFPQHAYVGLVIGTVVFSISTGLSEVFLSPTVASLPSDTPDKDMSVLHSLYGYGLVSVIVISTLFLKIFGKESWVWLTLIWATLPVITFVMFSTSPLPEIKISEDSGKNGIKRKNVIIMCMMCIFLGSCAENTMTNWISTYMERVLSIPKATGDILGMAVFGILLALTRTVYAKYGKNIMNMLIAGMAGAAVCYITVGISANILISTIACILTGIFTSMLWPGTLILLEEKSPNPGVGAYALMAAAGDLGASFAPQLMGVITDKVSEKFSHPLIDPVMHPEQIGLKTGMLSTAIYPMLGLILLLVMKRIFDKTSKKDQCPKGLILK